MQSFSIFFVNTPPEKVAQAAFSFLYSSLFYFHFSLNLLRDFSKEERKENVAFRCGEKH